MKLLTFSDTGRARTGVLLPGNDDILDLALAQQLLGGAEPPLPNPDYLSGMQGIIEAGDAGLEAISTLMHAVIRQGAGEATRPLATTTLLAPLPRPVRLRCFSVYEQHMRQSMAAVISNKGGKVLGLLNKSVGGLGVPRSFYRHPTYYKGNHLAVVGHDSDIIHPHGVTQLDYELEMAVVLGKQGRNIHRNDATDHIFGYCCFNDFSARDLLIKDILSGIGPQKGKDFDTSNALGPWIVTRDEIPDPYNLAMTVRVNGDIVGESNTGTMYHSIQTMIEWASWNETVYAGEVFATGAAGNGCGIERWEFIGVGDVVEISVEGLGTLRNRVVANTEANALDTPSAHDKKREQRA